jgi:hypothetical protein
MITPATIPKPMEIALPIKQNRPEDCRYSREGKGKRDCNGLLLLSLEEWRKYIAPIENPNETKTVPAAIPNP